MIYFICIIAIIINFDYSELKKSKKKTNIVFYTISMLIVLVVGMIYYNNQDISGIAEYLDNLF